MRRKRLPKSVRKYIRTQKAEKRKKGEGWSDPEFVKKLKKRLENLPP